MATLDEARFPRLAEYLAGLPQGLATHPDCQAKGAMVRVLCPASPLVPETGLPDEIRRLLVTPPLNSEWVQDTHFFGALLALADLHGFDAGRYATWVLEGSRNLFKSPVYKVLSLASPSMLLSLGGATWGSTHRGTQLAIEDGPVHGKSGAARLTFPERHLTNPDVLTAIRAGLQVALELSNAQGFELRIAEVDATSATFHATWS